MGPVKVKKHSSLQLNKFYLILSQYWECVRDDLIKKWKRGEIEETLAY